MILLLFTGAIISSLYILPPSLPHKVMLTFSILQTSSLCKKVLSAFTQYFPLFTTTIFKWDSYTCFCLLLTWPFLVLCDQTFTTTIFSVTTEMESIPSSLFSGYILNFFVAFYVIALLLFVHTLFTFPFLLLESLVLPLGLQFYFLTLSHWYILIFLFLQHRHLFLASTHIVFHILPDDHELVQISISDFCYWNSLL